MVHKLTVDADLSDFRDSTLKQPSASSILKEKAEVLKDFTRNSLFSSYSLAQPFIL